MSTEAPQFGTVRRGRKGYAIAEVDDFVGRVLERVNGDTSHDGLASGDIGVMWFNQARGSSAYDAEEVDQWLAAMRLVVEQQERSRREKDLPGERERSVLDMPAPPHYADRFPRVSRAVLGYTVAEVDRAMDELRADLAGPTPPSAAQVAAITFGEEAGGYRQEAVTSVLELIALARQT